MLRMPLMSRIVSGQTYPGRATSRDIVLGWGSDSVLIVSLHGNETMRTESDPQRSERTLYGTNATRGTTILPIAPWSVPNQICRVALSNVM